MVGIDEAATRASLLASGMSRRSLTAAVRFGDLVRARRDRYVSGSAPQAVQQAIRVGGLLTCLSLLTLYGIFVFENSVVHVHISRGMSRMRSPDDRGRPLPSGARRNVRLHWGPLVRPGNASSAAVGLVDALIHAVRCQQARYAIATIDSALNMGVIRNSDLADIFRALPRRFRVLLPLIDGRAQSGPETLVRLMARSIGCTVELQRYFIGVGYVDLLLDGWLVVECDGREFHENWSQQVKDRVRDLELAKLGYVTMRFTAAQIMYRPDEVAAALRAVIAARHPR